MYAKVWTEIYLLGLGIHLAYGVWTYHFPITIRHIAELKKIYSEDDIKWLNEPRQWVTMPNVVGMTEANALNTLRAKGLVARVVYLDSNNGNAEGICYSQDIRPGQKWNTDASLMIWIQRKDEMENSIAT